MEEKNLDNTQNSQTNIEKSMQSAQATDLVRTLDGRMVSKKDIKDGEIYYNAEGKKVRKVVRRVAKQTTPTAKPAVAKLDRPTEVAKDNENKPLQAKEDLPEIEPEVSKVHLINVVPQVQSEEDAPKEDNEQQQANDFRARINSKHAFLSRMRNNEKLTDPNISAGAKLNSSVVTGSGIKLATPVKAKGKKGEKDEIYVDKDVADLEDAIVKESYDDSVGKGKSTATAGGRVSNIGGKASNPNGSVLNSPVSNADNAFSRSLSGSGYMLATPVNASGQAVAVRQRRRKKKNPAKIWVPIIITACIYAVCCMFYFVTQYNFGDKSVQVGLYYLQVGDKARKEYYDGQPFNFHELLMVYNFGGENVDKKELNKFHLVDPNATPTLGYRLNNGFITAIWDGEYATATKRTVNVKVLYNNEEGYIPVTIYRNNLEGLGSDFSVRDLKNLQAGDRISATVFGLYYNKIIREVKGQAIEQELDPSEFELYITKIDGVTARVKLNYIADEDRYVLPQYTNSQQTQEIDYANSDIVIEAVSINNPEMKCLIYDKFAVQPAKKVDGGNGYVTYVPVNNADSKQTLGFELLNIGDTLVEDVVYNSPLRFRIDPDDGVKLDGSPDPSSGDKVHGNGYSLINEVVSFTTDNWSTSEVIEPITDEVYGTYYQIDRDKIGEDTTMLQICVEGCTNEYPVHFYNIADDGNMYEVYFDGTEIKDSDDFLQKLVFGQSNAVEVLNVERAGHIFEGWIETDAEGDVLPGVTTVSSSELSNALSSSEVEMRERYFTANYNAINYNVTCVSDGITLQVVSENGVPTGSNTIGYGKDLYIKVSTNNSIIENRNNIYYFKSGSYVQADGFNVMLPGSSEGVYIYSIGKVTDDVLVDTNNDGNKDSVLIDTNALFKASNLGNKFTLSTSENGAQITSIQRSVSSQKIRLYVKLSANVLSIEVNPILTYQNSNGTQYATYLEKVNDSYVYEIDANSINTKTQFSILGIKQTFTFTANDSRITTLDASGANALSSFTVLYNADGTYGVEDPTSPGNILENGLAFVLKTPIGYKLPETIYFNSLKPLQLTVDNYNAGEYTYSGVLANNIFSQDQSATRYAITTQASSIQINFAVPSDAPYRLSITSVNVGTLSSAQTVEVVIQPKNGQVYENAFKNADFLVVENNGVIVVDNIKVKTITSGSGSGSGSTTEYKATFTISKTQLLATNNTTFTIRIGKDSKTITNLGVLESCVSGLAVDWAKTIQVSKTLSLGDVPEYITQNYTLDDQSNEDYYIYKR